MKVVHLVPSVFGQNGVVGGGERYAMELARYIADRVETSLVAFGKEDSVSTMGSLRIRTLQPHWHIRGQQTNPVSIRILQEIRSADVIHCHQQHVMLSSLAAAVGRIARKRVVVSDLGGGGWDISSYISTDRWYNRHLHISEYSRKHSGHEGAPWANVIYGGVDSVKFSPDRSVARERMVAFVGRLLPHKGVDDLIQGIPEGVRLEIIGKPYRADYLTRLEQLAEGKDVIFRHDCGDDEIVNAYRRAICVVLPSVYRDCYGNQTGVPELLGQTLLEGMACETPAICTDVASLPEVVRDGETGFVVPPNDPGAIRAKIAWLAGHEDKAREYGEAARMRVLKHFTWPAVVGRCLELYPA